MSPQKKEGLIFGTIFAGMIGIIIFGCIHNARLDPEPQKYARKCLKSETEIVFVPAAGGVGMNMGGGLRATPRTTCVEYGPPYMTQAWYDWNERQKLKEKENANTIQ